MDARRPMHAVVKEVEVHTVPFASERKGERWDLFSGPDLYYEAYEPDGERLHTSEVVSDVRPRDLPVALGGEFSVEASGPYVVRLLDADLTREEVIGQVILDPERLADKHRGRTLPTVVQLEDGETTLRLDLVWREGQS